MRLVIAMVLGVAGVAAAASSTNEWVGTARLLHNGTQWSPNSAPTNGANIRDWVIGGSLFNNTWGTAGDLVHSTNGVRVYTDTVYIQSGVNLVHTNGGSVFDLGFTVAGDANSRIVVKSGFDIASGVTNNVILKSTKWASSNANNVITFNHNGTGTLKIQNDWVETPGVGMVYKGSAGNKVEFGAASTYTGGTTLDNVAASMTINNSIGTSGNVVLTNGSSLNMSTFTLGNKIVAAAGSDVKTVISGVAIRTSAIEAQGNMLLTNSAAGTAQWNGAVTIGSAGQIDLAQAAGAVTQLGGTLSGSGTVRTATAGTTVFNTALDASGFSGDTVIRGITQMKADNVFGSGGKVLLNNSGNLRVFAQTNKLALTFNNGVTVQGDSTLHLTSANSLTNNASGTVGGDITFAGNYTLTTGAGGNADNLTATNTLTLNGVIKENASIIGNVLVDNHWTTAYYTNSITKFSGANTYHGQTDVQFGRLQLVGNGSIDNSTNLHVQSQGIFDVSAHTGGAYTYGGTLDGTGLIVGSLTLTGNLKPGNSPGMLTFDGALTLANGSTTTMEITDLANDVLKGNGVSALTVNGNVVFDFTGYAGGVTNGYTIALSSLFNNWGSVATNGATYSALGLTGGQSLGFTGGNLTVIPEPATIGMLGLGALITIMLRRMRMP